MKSSLRISVADDEPDMRQYFQRILPLLGHTVVSVAETGEELVKQCRTHEPDLVITDVRMPKMDGIAAASAVYEERPVPMILVSAYHDDSLVQRARSAHALAYLIKPIKQADLQAAIGIALGRFDPSLRDGRADQNGN
jgi:CheY-like chemotaxis protein